MVQFPEPLPVLPFVRPLSGQEVRLPGSKSITNRALLLAALTSRKVRLEGVLRSEDTHWMIDCLRRLGVEVSEIDSETLEVCGCGGLFPETQADLQVGTAGTVARLLVGILGAQPEGRYRVDGSEAMRQRPMEGLMGFLAEAGCGIHYEAQEGRLPFVLNPRGIRGGRYRVDASESSQILSGILMAGALAQDALIVELAGETVSHPFIDMTLRMMESFGAAEVKRFPAYSAFSVSEPSGYDFRGEVYAIERDVSAASYFMVLPKVVGGTIRIPGFFRNGLQGDAAFADKLTLIGGEVGMVRERQGQPCLEVSFPGNLRYPIDTGFNAISDTFLTLAAVAPLLPKPLRISGIAHTRKQESDRVRAVAQELRKLGQEVEEEEDSLRILPNLGACREVARAGVGIDTYKDHRIAMSFGILGCCDLLGGGYPWLSIRDPGCTAKTFPAFFETLERLRQSTLHP